MSAFCIPTPCIVPLRLPVFGESNKVLDTDTKIEMLCDTELPGIEVFYTVDGTKPQPYVLGIVQGSKTFKYAKPFVLPPGKITVKALAIHAVHHSICSNVITKTFYVKDLSDGRKRKPKKRVAKAPVPPVKANEGPLEVAAVTCELGGDGEEIVGEEIMVEIDDIIDDDSEEKYDVDNGDIISHEEFATASCESPSRHLVKIQSNPAAAASEEFDEPLSAEVVNETFTVEEIEDIPGTSEPALQVEDGVEVSTQAVANHPEMPVQFCSSCNKVNSLLARYCDSCGAKLHKACHLCKEKNPVIANFCQFCGNKFTLEQSAECPAVEKLSKNKGIVAKPVTVNKGVSCIKLTCASKLIQTDPFGEKIRKILGKPVREQTSSKTASKYVQTPETFDTSKRKSPNSTPGGGYWRLQTDYICNHLKAYTNNNVEFRNSIASPSLGRFLSASAEQQEDNFTINISFEILPKKGSVNFGRFESV